MIDPVAMENRWVKLQLRIEIQKNQLGFSR